MDDQENNTLKACSRAETIAPDSTLGRLMAGVAGARSGPLTVQSVDPACLNELPTSAPLVAGQAGKAGRSGIG